MIDTLFIEEEVKNHPRVLRIEEKFPFAKKIFCEKFSEIFNRTAQSFHLQKQRPALILAKKYGSFLHPLPSKNSIGRKENFYFSPLLNCPFNCSYCFLQGFYRSAHFVYFVNLEDFSKAIDDFVQKDPSVCLFCGYDSDSLALEPLTSFISDFFSVFEKHPQTLFELRTKSTAIDIFSKKNPLENLVIAFSINPQIVSDHFEKKAPSLTARLQAIQKLQKNGWKTALRFDPIIDHQDAETTYQNFFEEVFSKIDAKNLHSVTLGALRFPKTVHENIKKISRKNPLLAKLTLNSYELFGVKKETRLVTFCQTKVLRQLSQDKLFIDSFP